MSSKDKKDKKSGRNPGTRTKASKTDLTLVSSYGSEYASPYEPGEADMDSPDSFDQRPGFGIHQRPDERVREDAFLALERHPDIDTADIELLVKDGTITLSGTVESFSAKRAAESAVISIPGVRDLRNGLVVKTSSAA